MQTCLFRHWCKAPGGSHLALLAALTLLAVLLLSACAAATTPTPSPTAPPSAPSPTTPPTATTTPTQTALPSPTATPTASEEPSSTQTATPLLAILSDGFDAWCLPGDSYNRGVVTSQMPSDAGKYRKVKNSIALTVPTGSCTFVYTFNQPAPVTAELQIFDGLDHLAFTMPLTSPDGQPNVGLITLDNKVMVDPPYYSISFRLAVFTPENGQLWTSKVFFNRPIPAACFDPSSGILPDPVTGACPAADPREPELCRKRDSLSCHHTGVTSED